MANYEIMLVVDGSLSIEQAQQSIDELVSVINKSENYKFTDFGNRDLAYKIKNQTKGWYFQYNFSANDANVINEFRRLATINKNVLRQLILNLDKEYGARALMNSKKVAKSEIKLKRFTERMEKYRQEKFERESAVKELEQINAIKPEESTNE